MTNIIPFPIQKRSQTSPNLHNFAWRENWQTKQEKSITICQAIMLKILLTTGNIEHINTIEEIERLQNIKLDWRLWYNNDLLSIPLSQIAPSSQFEDVMRKLRNIGAESTVFLRYAWRWTQQRNISQLSSVLSTQTCCI